MFPLDTIMEFFKGKPKETFQQEEGTHINKPKKWKNNYKLSKTDKIKRPLLSKQFDLVNNNQKEVPSFNERISPYN
jgi:hypothetical protein